MMVNATPPIPAASWRCKEPAYPKLVQWTLGTLSSPTTLPLSLLLHKEQCRCAGSTHKKSRCLRRSGGGTRPHRESRCNRSSTSASSGSVTESKKATRCSSTHAFRKSSKERAEHCTCRRRQSHRGVSACKAAIRCCFASTPIKFKVSNSAVSSWQYCNTVVSVGDECSW